MLAIYSCPYVCSKDNGMRLDILYLTEAKDDELLEKLVKFARKWYGKISPIPHHKKYKLLLLDGKKAVYFNDEDGSTSAVTENMLKMSNEAFYKKYINL